MSRNGPDGMAGGFDERSVRSGLLSAVLGAVLGAVTGSAVRATATRSPPPLAAGSLSRGKLPAMRVPALLAALAFVLIALLHAYWALGGVWPGRDRESLARTVVGGPAGMPFPSSAATWGVVAVLLVGAAVALGAAGVVALPLPQPALRAAALLGAGVLLARGLEGYVDVRLRPETVGSPFVPLNVRLYSPLCLALAVLVALSALT